MENDGKLTNHKTPPKRTKPENAEVSQDEERPHCSKDEVRGCQSMDSLDKYSSFLCALEGLKNIFALERVPVSVAM